MLQLLLIDDNPDDRALIIHHLKHEFPDLQVEEITEAGSFKQALAKGGFHLVITDYQLGWSDGLKVLRAAKSYYPNCPVIMFTGSGDQEIAVAAMKAGLDDYIVKSIKHFVRLPVVIHSVLQRVESQLRADRLEVRLQTLLTRLNVGVFRATLDGQLLEGNASFLRLLGVDSLKEAQTLDLYQLFLPTEANLQPWNQEREVQLHRVDGSWIWISLSQTLSNSEVEPVIEGLIEDITERKRAEAERQQMLSREQLYEVIRESEKRFRQMVELCPDAIFIQSGEQIVFANSAAVKLYGATSPEQLIGRQVLDHVHPDYQEIVKERIEHLKQGKQTELLEQKLVRLDGTVIDVEVAAIPFIYNNQPAAQVLIHDISIRKRAEEEMLKLLQRERELSDIKSRVITTISHECRTPLTTILMSAELLENYPHKLTPEKKQTHLQRIRNSAKHLTQIVNDVLTMSGAEAENIEFKPTLLNLEKICYEILEEIKSEMASLAVPPTLTFSIRGEVKDVCLDEKLLRYILINLLSNAVKYSPKGGTIRFEVESTQGFAQFLIRDEGIGIPAADIPRLFEAFHRGGNVGASRGTGLGLAIVKKCVDLHKGEIRVESVENQGTTLSVSLPLNYGV